MATSTGNGDSGSKSRPHRSARQQEQTRRNRWIRAIPYVLLIPVLVLVVDRQFGFPQMTPTVQFVAFYPWLAIVPLAIAAIWAMRRQWLVVILAGVLVVVMMWPTFLNSAPALAEDSGGSNLRVVSANVLKGAGTESLMQQVEGQDVDVLVVLECPEHCVAELSQPQNAKRFPYQVVGHGVGPAGSVIVSSLPLTEIPSVSGSETTQFAMPAAQVEVGGTPVVIKAAHPFPPIPTGVSYWKNDLATLEQFVESNDKAQIIAGDFNATIDHKQFRRILEVGDLQNATAGLGGTWPSNGPTWLTPQLDHILISQSIGLKSSESWYISGADHRAVVADLVISARN